MGALGRQRGVVRLCRDEQEDNQGLAVPREGSVLLPPRARVTGLRLKPQENPALARVLPEQGARRRNNACFSLPPPPSSPPPLSLLAQPSQKLTGKCSPEGSPHRAIWSRAGQGRCQGSGPQDTGSRTQWESLCGHPEHSAVALIKHGPFPLPGNSQLPWG